jgi:NAD(P)-dependent dehydrogenase (short-subunit alcohol dehydrogenase family)
MKHPADHSSSYKRPLQSSPAPIALVTGASSGFGLLISVTLAQKGYQVIAAMRDPDKREQLLMAARAAQVERLIECVQLDVTDHPTIQRAMTRIVENYGRIDVVVNNAGFAAGGFVEDVPIDDWRRQMETNFIGLIAVTKSVLPFMREQRSGHIINISSVSGRIGFPGYAPYVASKFAVEGFSEALRLEMKPFGVHVVLIEPGAYPTSIWKKGFDSIRTSADSPYKDKLESVLGYSRSTLNKNANPQDVADAVARILSLRQPKLRYSMGRGVPLLLWSKALLPWNWLERLLLIILSTTKK